MEYDVTFDWKTQEHSILLDIGDDAVTLSRELLEAMLNDLNEADGRG